MNKIVEVFPWNENFETGIPLIDEQHKVLIDLLNLLVSHLAFQSDVPILNSVLSQLKDYVAKHFAEEEIIWHLHFQGDPWLKWHEKAHIDFVSVIVKAYEDKSAEPYDEVLEKLVKFLTHWLVNHILEADKRMAKAVLKLPTGISLARAKEEADKEMSGTTRILIDTIMSMYDKLANSTVKMSREIHKRKIVEAKLSLAKQKAEEANIAKTAFLSNMSHEIRTPLNAISGLLYLLKSEGITPRQEEFISKIDQASTHLLSVLNDILDLSKIEANKLDLEEKEIEVEKLVGNVCSILADRLLEKNLKLSVTNDLFPKHLVGDQTRLQQVMINFANNAIKFTEKGSVTFRTKKVEENDDSVLLKFEVQDTGIGISQESIERLFQSFEQADSSITKNYGGTGLGLALNKKLVTLMGGDVGVESTLGVGSTFWFTAKLGKGLGAGQNESFDLAESPVDILKRDFKGSRVLVVDNEPFSRGVTCMLLEAAGLSVDHAENGIEAIEKVELNNYQLVLMDLQMPKMDGLEATRKIRKLAKGQKLPVIGVTGYSFSEYKQLCFEAGMSDFLTKPVVPETLFSNLLKWLSNEGVAKI